MDGDSASQQPLQRFTRVVFREKTVNYENDMRGKKQNDRKIKLNAVFVYMHLQARIN